MRKELDKVYDPKQVEDRTYQFWLDGNYFHAKVDPQKEPYTIVIPPPNITGQLHMGHALERNLAGHSDPLAPYAGQKRFMAARHRPRLHRYGSEDCGGDEKRRAHQRRNRPRRVL